MKMSPKAALLAALMLGGAAAAAPALAKDKKPEAAAAAPALKVSKEVRTAQAAAQAGFAAAEAPNKEFNAALNAKRQAMASGAATAAADAQLATAGAALAAALQATEPQIAAVEAAAKTNDELYVAQSMRYTKERFVIVASSGGDSRKIAAANGVLAPYLDKLLANPSTPAAALGGYAFDRAWIASNARQNAQAAAYFERAQAAGYPDPDLRIQIARTKMDAGDLPGGLAALDAEIAALRAAGKPVPSDYYTLAINRLYLAKNPDAIVWTQRWLTAYPDPKNWHDAIITFGFAGKNPRAISNAEKLDLYRLLSASNGLADESEYYLYADAAQKVGVPYETLTVLKTGQAKGKVRAQSTNTIDLLDAANRSIKADSPIASYETRAKASATGELAAQTGDAYLGQANYAKAVELYGLAKTKSVKDPDALNTHLGIAQAMAGDKTAAKASFEAVGPGSRKDIASLWLTWLALSPAA